MKSIILVALGGALGSVLRYCAGEFLPYRQQILFPWATLTVNLLGCFLIGLAAGLTVNHGWLAGNFRTFFIIGFCGGFTTFSAFSREIIQLLSQNLYLHAFIYVLVSVIVGVLLTFSGLFIVNHYHL
jgi:CrcB protein